MSTPNTQPEWTYSLNIEGGDPEQWRSGLKNKVAVWLTNRGIVDFIEGARDDLDLDPQYEAVVTGGVIEFDTDSSPLQLYKYDRDWLEELVRSITDEFGANVVTSIEAIKTSVWTEGWKESFRPIETDRFVIHPPWDRPTPSSGKLLVEIEPGMAFGTGQHATTLNCLRLWERHVDRLCPQHSQKRLLDVGSGSGILAIAAAKSGAYEIYATDIDPDAVLAISANAETNGVKIAALRGSVPANLGQIHLAFANILTPILCRILPELSAVIAVGGFAIFSGILEEERGFFEEQLEAHGCSIMDAVVTNGWLGILAQKDH